MTAAASAVATAGLWLYLMMVTEGYKMFCEPKLWEGTMWTLKISHSGQGPQISETIAIFSIDVVGQRIATLERQIQPDGQETSTFFLYYFPAHLMFMVKDGVCTSSRVDGGVTQNCVDMPNKNIQEVLNEFLPTYEKGLYCSGVRAEVQGVNIFYSVSPVDGNNIPLMQQQYGVFEEASTYTLNNIMNVTLGIKDPSIFTPPTNCEPNEGRPVRAPEFLLSLLGRSEVY